MKVRSRLRYFVKDGEVYVRGVIDYFLKSEKTGVYPYAFVRSDMVDKARRDRRVVDVLDTDLKDEFGNKVYRYECSNPKDVAKVRDKVGYNVTYEADIPYIRRLLVDKELIVDYSDSDVFVDIEVDDESGFPSQYGEYKILSIAYSFGNTGRTKWLYVGDFNTERDMISEFLNEIISSARTVMVAYNVAFDYWHLLYRAEKLGLNTEYLSMMNLIDLYEEYKREIKGLSSYTLLEVARHEGLDIEVKSRTKKVSDMSRQELMEYNMNDVELIKEIDRKYGFVSLKLDLAETVNLTIDDLTPVRIGDTLFLRRARELGYVLRNTVKSVKKKGYAGAYVMQPKRLGLTRGVAVYDVNSLYPNVIIANNIDIGNFKGEILPEILKGLLEERKQYKALYKVFGEQKYYIRQWTLKILANSLYGLLGTSGFRYFDERKAETVTRLGREIITKAAKAVRELGYEVLYIDTDSLFIVVGDADDEVLEGLKDFINSVIAPLEVKLEKVGDVIFLAKKRYIFRTRNGEEDIKGVEIRRGDWPVLVKEVMRKVIDMVFEGKSSKEIRDFLSDIRVRMRKCEFDDKLIMVKGIDVNKKYKVNAQHVRAYKKLVKRTGVTNIDRVMFVYVGSDVEPLLEESEIEKYRCRLNYNKYWQLLNSSVGRILNAVYRSESNLLKFGESHD